MSRKEENGDAFSDSNGIHGAAGLTPLEAVNTDSGISASQIWGTSWRTPGPGRNLEHPSEFLQSSFLESRQPFLNFLDSSFNIWRNSSSDEEESRSSHPNANSLLIPTPIRQQSSHRFPFPIASVDIPLDPNPFQGLPERVARKHSAKGSEMDGSIPGAKNADQQSSPLVS